MRRSFMINTVHHSIIRIIKSRRICRGACMLEIRNAYKILIKKCERRRPLCRPKHRWEDNTEMNI
jgi:hypothetical protein